MKASVFQCPANGIHKYYSRANTKHGCLSKLSFNQSLLYLNFRQFLLKWSIHKDDYAREENNAFCKPHYLMVKELVPPGCKKSQAT